MGDEGIFQCDKCPLQVKHIFSKIILARFQRGCFVVSVKKIRKQSKPMIDNLKKFSYTCSGMELWSTFSKYTNPDKLEHSSPECSFAIRNTLSAPVTTCAPVKPRTTSTYSNTLVIDAQQVTLSAPTALLTPQAMMSPSLPPGWS